MKRYLLFLLLLTVSYVHVYAQHNALPCGTHPEKSPWLLEYQKAPERYAKNENDTIYVPLTIHIVGTDNGSGYFPVENILTAMCELNEDFEPSNIYFYVEGDYRYINNSAFYDHTIEDGYRMMLENNVDNTLNTYFVQSPAGNCGYSIYGLGVAMNKSCSGSGDNTFAHELGHAFSLPHTFFGWEGVEYGDLNLPAPEQLEENGSLVEKMDGSNCDSAGDGFCDTPSDYLNYRWACNAEGQSTVFQTDPDSVRFRSDGTLFMSYSLDECSGRFSEEQTGAMRANLLDERQNFLYNQEPPTLIESPELIVNSPLAGDTIPVNQLEFDWEDIEGATRYYIEISRISNFSISAEKAIITTSNFVPSEALSIGKKYYWRVTPFSGYDQCQSPIRGEPFVTSDEVSNLAELDAAYRIAIVPNVLSNPTAINVNIETPTATRLTTTLYSITGERVMTQIVDARAGKNTHTLAVDGLESGMYFLNVSDDVQQRTLKLMVL